MFIENEWLGNYFITRKNPLTDEEKIICHIEVRK